MNIIHISYDKIDFKCPHCNKEYLDSDDKYVNRCNDNKCGYTKIKCSCSETFGMTYDYMGQAVGFDLNRGKKKLIN